MSDERVDERIIDKPTREHVLPQAPVGKVKKLETTPNVQNVKNWILQNTVATTVTDLRRGQDGQPVYVLGDGFTTFANNANIKTSTGAAKLLLANRAYLFVQFSGVWVEVGP